MVVVVVVVVGTAACMDMSTQSKPYTCTHLGFLKNQT
jgi:hypothetical protein